MSSVSVIGSSAATTNGQSRRAIFHGGFASGRAEVGVAPLAARRGGKLPRWGAEPFDEQAEEPLHASPRRDRIGASIRQPIEPAKRFPSLEQQFHLPPQPVRREHALGRHAPPRCCRDKQHVAGQLEPLGGDFALGVAAQPCACPFGLLRRQPLPDEANVERRTVSGMGA